MEDWELKGKLALCILDMQHDIVGKGGKGEPLGFPQALEESGIVPKIQSLLQRFREKKLPVVYVVAEFNPIVPIPAYGTFYDYMKVDRPCGPGTRGTEIIPELTPVWGEPVVRKWNVSIFSHSTLEEVLRSYGAETLILVGVATNLVIHTAAVAATDHGYSVVIPEDGITSSDKEAHDFTVKKVLPMFSKVTTIEEILKRV